MLAFAPANLAGALDESGRMNAKNFNEDVACRIVATDEAGLLRLEATAQSRRAIAGAYVFTVSKRSSSGASENVQSGEVSLDPGRGSILTRVVLDGSARGHYSAKLSLKWDQGSVSCLLPCLSVSRRHNRLRKLLAAFAPWRFSSLQPRPPPPSPIPLL
jgi:hypothetical protein